MQDSLWIYWVSPVLLMPTNHWVAYDRAGICPRSSIFQIKHLEHISYQLAGRLHPPFSHIIWALLIRMGWLILQWVTWYFPWEVGAMCLGWKSPVSFLPLFLKVCSVPLSRSIVCFLCVFTIISMGTSPWMMRNVLEESLLCIVYNSASIVVSPMDSFLIWSRIIQMIDALVLIVMDFWETQEKDFME